MKEKLYIIPSFLVKVCSWKSSIPAVVAASLPPFWRMLQCIRRFITSKQAFLHLVNAGKYFVMMMTIIFGGLSRWNSGKTWNKTCLSLLYLYSSS
jgi:hypothetical protein